MIKDATAWKASSRIIFIIYFDNLTYVWNHCVMRESDESADPIAANLQMAECSGAAREVHRPGLFVINEARFDSSVCRHIRAISES